MRKIAAIVRKEFLQLLRDRKLVPLLFLAPILQILLLGYAVDFDIRNIPTVVCDLDRTATSREFIDSFFNSGYFTPKARVDDLRSADAYLDNGKASMVLVIERGFGARMTERRTAFVSVIVDGTESQSATIGANYAAMIGTRFTQKVMEDVLEKMKTLGIYPAGIEPEIRVFYNPALKSRNFMIPGVLGLILMTMTMMLTSMAIVREKETGTMEQLIVTPIRPSELIAGKLIPFLLIGLLDALLVVALVILWFGVPIRGSLPLLFALTLVFMSTTLGLGLFISTISRNQQQAMMTAVFFMMPMMLLSGFVFPIENMPKAFQWVTFAVPLRYYLVVIRGIFLKGVGFSSLWDQALGMAVFGGAILTLSVLRFRKKLG